MIAPLALGIVLGFVGSIPATGPLLFLVIDAGLTRDRPRALSLAVGGALAESAYVALAFAGAGQLLQLLPVSPQALKLASAAIVVALGLWIVRAKADNTAKVANPAPAGDFRATAFMTGFSIVLLNPGFLAYWSVVAAFVYSSGVLAAGATATAALALGCAGGIVLWFAAVYALATRATSNVSEQRLQILRRGVGGVLIVLGVLFGGSSLV